MQEGSHNVAVGQMRFGWWALLAFLSTGVVLEALQGFKAGFYLDVSNETRRHLWTLGHAHGSLLALVNVAFGVCLAVVPTADPTASRRASVSLRAAAILLPGGFFLGGAVFYAGDPGLGVALVPLGALALFAGVLLAARSLRSR